MGCDTLRAVFTSHFTYQKISHADELLKIVSNLDQKLHQKPIIVITGGEPLLHHKNEILLKFITALIQQKYS